MNHTNSNSITSILICALNAKSKFRTEMLTKFEEITQSKLDDIYFYDGTHSPLKIKEMKNKQVDIYARRFGEQKVRLMIEIKANLYEALQESQKSIYKEASEALGCGLLYIVPKNYKHKDMLPSSIIEWETVLKIAKKCDEKLKQQIDHFVEADIEEDKQSILQKGELQLLQNPQKLGKSYKEQRKKLKDCINSGNVGVNEKNFSVSEYEFGYYFDNKKFFLGYSYIRKNFDDVKYHYDFFLCIQETKDNGILAEKEFYYDDGWYYIPIKPVENMDIKTIEDLKKMKKMKKMKEIKPKFYCNLNLDEIQKFEINNNVRNVYSISKMIKLLCEGLNNKDFEIRGDFEIQNNYFGYFFHEKNKQGNNIFIGIDEIDENNEDLYFVFELYKKEWKKQKLNGLESYNDFISAKTFDEQKEKFAKLIQAAKKELEK